MSVCAHCHREVETRLYRVRVLGDLHRWCQPCMWSAREAGLDFVEAPEWVQRADEHRLPTKAWAA